MRKITKEVKIGNRKIGNNNPILIQSMCNTDTRDTKKTIEQILELEKAGCEIIRVAVPDMESAQAIKTIKENIHIPLVADIHFDYQLAIKSMLNGVDKIRLNPGNIGSKDNIKKVVELAKEKNIPIRIGVNSGSLEKDLLVKYGKPTAKALVESALRHTDILEKLNFEDIVISIKSSSVPFSIECYEELSKAVPYPLHVGVTEAGTIFEGTIKSAIGIGAILNKGIGDTIRVSLTDDPVKEVHVAKEILKSLKLRDLGIEFVSCPTCGRTKIDLIEIARKVRENCADIDKNIKVAVMGCIVNGPGVAKDTGLRIG